MKTAPFPDHWEGDLVGGINNFGKSTSKPRSREASPAAS
jgi:hypothetical protein